MTIRKSRYEVADDIFHFETSGSLVQIFDREGKQLGNLNELCFEGKVIDGVDFKSIKTTGNYNVKGLKGVPSTIPADKRAILSIRSIGNPNNLDVIFYQIIGANGVISENTIAGGKESGWGNGGVTLDNAIKNITNNIGDTSKLTTKQKDVVSAINEVITGIKSDRTAMATHVKDYIEFKKHNHDDRYIKKDGGAMDGNLTLKNGNGIQLRKADGKDINYVNIDKKDKVTMGDTSVHINIMSKNGLEVNGHKVFTSENAGEGSGIDADKLDGLDSKKFVRTDIDNQLYGNLHLHNAKGIMIDINEKNVEGGICFRRKDGKNAATVHANAGGELLFFTNGVMNTKLKTNGTVNTKSNIELDISSGEKRVVFKLNDSDAGIGLYRNKNSGYLGIYDWAKGNFIAQFGTGKDKNAVGMNQAPYIQGRRLFLQGGQPSGDIPVGSIWVS